MIVSVKAVPVYYDGTRYTKGETFSIKNVHFNGKLFDKIDYSELTEEDLKKVKNDDLKAYLTNKGIRYSANATKDDLIKLVAGGGEADA